MIIKFGTYYESQPIKLGYNKNGKPVKEEIKPPIEQVLQKATDIFERNQNNDIQELIRNAGMYNSLGEKR